MAPVSDDESQASLGLRWDEEEAAASSPQERFVTMVQVKAIGSAYCFFPMGLPSSIFPS